MLLTQVDDVLELCQEFILSGQCPVTVAVVGGSTELTVRGQQCMEDSEGHETVRVGVQLATESSSVISSIVK